MRAEPKSKETGIVMDVVTSPAIISIKIKSGEARLYHNGTLKATLTTGVPYDKDEMILWYKLSNPDSADHWLDLDYTEIRLGRAF